jgi:hypothetical protein
LNLIAADRAEGDSKEANVRLHAAEQR